MHPHECRDVGFGHHLTYSIAEDPRDGSIPDGAVCNGCNNTYSVIKESGCHRCDGKFHPQVGDCIGYLVTQIQELRAVVGELTQQLAGVARTAAQAQSHHQLY